MADNTGTCVVAVQPMTKIACTTHNCSNRAAYVIGHPAKVGYNKYQICEPCMKNVLRSAKKLGLLDELVGKEFPTEEFLALSVSTNMKKAELLAIVAAYSVLGVTEDNNKSEIVAKIQEVQVALYKETTREAPAGGDPIE